MFEDIDRYVLTDASGKVFVYQGLADMTGFDGTASNLLRGKNTVQEALMELDRILNRKMEAAVYTATATTTYSGSAAPFLQTVNIPGIKSTDDIGYVDVVTSTTDPTLANNQIKHFGYITKVIPGNGNIQLRCDKKKPQYALPLQVVIFRKSFE